MEPEEEPGGAAVREVYEEVTKTKQSKKSSWSLLLLSSDGNQEGRGTASFIQYLTETFVVMKFKELQFCMLELGYSVVRWIN